MKNAQEYDASILLNTLRLLYVEDDAEALQELAQFLRRRVSSLTVATNGMEALKCCLSQSFDVILCDLWMPEMDGFAFIKRLRAEGIQTPIVITSAFSDAETILKAVDLGIVKYCVKPVEADELLDCLCRIAAQRLSEAGELRLPNNKLMDRQQRLECEKAVKSGCAYLLKTLTGKGPKDVHVSLGTDTLAVLATEVLTPLELSLLQLPGNTGMLSFLRRSLYNGNKNAFEAVISEIFNLSAILDEVQISFEENTDRLVFKLRMKPPGENVLC